jgi:hypothetical protein
MLGTGGNVRPTLTLVVGFIEALSATLKRRGLPILLAAVLVGAVAVPASADSDVRLLDANGDGGVIHVGTETLALFQFSGDSDGIQLELKWWFDVTSEDQIHDPEVSPDCLYSGNSNTDPELMFRNQGDSFVITIKGGQTTCGEKIVRAELEISGSSVEVLDPASDCSGVRRTTGDDTGIARIYIETDAGVVLDAGGVLGSGRYVTVTGACPSNS